ncbi:hypothetical protein MCHI_001617 [Candidatus Magnetoovum chiemensis]|nr:hypothetical protein MCHI_001617 [Candidatus Magnetoovum chiemensis]
MNFYCDYSHTSRLVYKPFFKLKHHPVGQYRKFCLCLVCTCLAYNCLTIHILFILQVLGCFVSSTLYNFFLTPSFVHVLA